MGHLMRDLTDAASHPPYDLIPDEATTTSHKELSSTYLRWRKSDRLLRGWIIGTLSEESVSLLVGLESSYQVWHALQEAYAQESQERYFQLTQQLTYMRKEAATSLQDHLQSFKTLCGHLAAIGRPLSHNMKVFFPPQQLGSDIRTLHHLPAQATDALLRRACAAAARIRDADSTS
ncbi:hypothetical protein F2P56_024458 [Juglans regia]|uniref:Uncharacterized protein n=1 Tax=Juglans regia TaxID=51240 RepID=A0A833TSL8_JUGRE|nr:hypothetical protein F2P56_024458 [Juglans regia]